MWRWVCFPPQDEYVRSDSSKAACISSYAKEVVPHFAVDSAECFDEKQQDGEFEIAGQLERCPDTHRLHYQFTCRFAKRVDFPLAVQYIQYWFPGAHVQTCDCSWKANVRYATKEDSRVAGPWCYPGELIMRQGFRSDLSDAIVCLRERGWSSLCDEYPQVVAKYSSGMLKLDEELARSGRNVRRRVKVLVLWGPPRIGKTTCAYALSPSLFRLPLPTRNETLWWDGYHGEQVVLFDDFYGQVPMTRMMNLLDSWPLRLGIKGAHTYAWWNTFVITSNAPPDAWYKWERYEDDARLRDSVRAFFSRLDYVVECKAEDMSSLLALCPDVHDAGIPGSVYCPFPVEVD